MADGNFSNDSGLGNPKILQDYFGLSAVEDCNLGEKIIESLSRIIQIYEEKNSTNAPISALTIQSTLLHAIAIHSEKGEDYLSAKADYSNNQDSISRLETEYYNKDPNSDGYADYEANFLTRRDAINERQKTVTEQIKEFQSGAFTKALDRFEISKANFPNVDTETWDTVINRLTASTAAPGVSLTDALCVKSFQK